MTLDKGRECVGKDTRSRYACIVRNSVLNKGDGNPYKPVRMEQSMKNNTPSNNNLVSTWNVLVAMTPEQRTALLQLATLVGATPVKVDNAPVAVAPVVEAPVKVDAFEKATPSEKHVGKSIRMTEFNRGRFGGIKKAFEKEFGKCYNAETKCFEFSSKAKAKKAYDSQVAYAKANPQYPLIVEIC